MNYYKKEIIKKIENSQKKWVILTVFISLIAIGLFILFLLLSSYDFHLIYQILSSIVLSALGIYFVFVIDVIFVENHYKKKHYLLTFLYGSEIYKGKVVEIGKVITVSPRIQARLIVIEVDSKKLTLYLLKDFNFKFEINSEVLIESKNRFIFSIKDGTDE